MTSKITAPFVWFGGKSRWAKEINRRLGTVQTYAEPFAGSLAVLLTRGRAKHEVITDLDGGLVNFYRAVVADPEAVWRHADWPTGYHDDLVARRRWLAEWIRTARQHLHDDPWWHDAKAAGIWLHARNTSIRGVIAPNDTVPQATPGGVHGVTVENPVERLRAIASRLKHVVVLARPWRSALTRKMLHPRGERVVGIVMDPPYIGDRAPMYTEDGASSDGASVESYEWSVAHGRRYRICFCCTAGTFPIPEGWQALTRNFTGPNDARRRAARKDMVLFSPRCLP